MGISSHNNLMDFAKCLSKNGYQDIYRPLLLPENTLFAKTSNKVLHRFIVVDLRQAVRPIEMMIKEGLQTIYRDIIRDKRINEDEIIYWILVLRIHDEKELSLSSAELLSEIGIWLFFKNIHKPVNEPQSISLSLIDLEDKFVDLVLGNKIRNNLLLNEGLFSRNEIKKLNNAMKEEFLHANNCHNENYRILQSDHNKLSKGNDTLKDNLEQCRIIIRKGNLILPKIFVSIGATILLAILTFIIQKNIISPIWLPSELFTLIILTSLLIMFYILWHFLTKKTNEFAWFKQL